MEVSMMDRRVMFVLLQMLASIRQSVRPRFSLRLVLVAFALLSVLLYVLIIRPTTLANRFVDAVGRRDYDAAQALMSNAGEWDGVVNPPQVFKADRVYAELMPREWEDVWSCERRIVLRVARHNDRNENYVDWTEDTDVVAHPHGLKVQMLDNLNYYLRIARPRIPAGDYQSW
jgi:hypothetical protein